MEISAYLNAIERDGRAFLASCEAAAPDTIIAACPEWRPADLLWHLAEVHYFWRSIVELRAQHYDVVVDLQRPADDAELPDLYRHGLGALLIALATVDPATSVWTWSSQHDVAFVVRRMAQETAVHRWDADHAAGLSVPIEAELASDGIDEFLEHFVDQPKDGNTIAGSVHLHCTDVAGEWTTRPEGDRIVTTREHAKGDCALRGPADALLRALWRRASIDDVDVVGDRAIAEQFLAWSKLD